MEVLSGCQKLTSRADDVWQSAEITLATLANCIVISTDTVSLFTVHLSLSRLISSAGSARDKPHLHEVHLIYTCGNTSQRLFVYLTCEGENTSASSGKWTIWKKWIDCLYCISRVADYTSLLFFVNLKIFNFALLYPHW